MKIEPLSEAELKLLAAVFSRHPEVTEVRIFGSRAKGTHWAGSDVDLALRGEIDDLRAEAIAAELDALPLPYRFDVVVFDEIESEALRDHIRRVGIAIDLPGAAAKPVAAVAQAHVKSAEAEA